MKMFWLMVASLALHIVGLAVLDSSAKQDGKKMEKVKIKIVETPPSEPPKPIPPKPKEPPKPKKVASERKPKSKPVETAQPIQGLSKEAFDEKGTIAAPAGNTMMTEDKGIRMNPDDVKPLAQDMSRDPELIASSVTVPDLTSDAIDAGIEGIFVVDVFVDANGQVAEAELTTKPGYGMDELLIQAAMGAKFRPRLDKAGKALAGWSEIKFKLEIE
jgi:protein TonB